MDPTQLHHYLVFKDQETEKLNFRISVLFEREQCDLIIVDNFLLSTVFFTSQKKIFFLKTRVPVSKKKTLSTLAFGECQL